MAQSADPSGRTVWVPGDEPESWRSQGAGPAGGRPAEVGRVRVRPTYEFPVFQPGGVGLSQSVTVTDWLKQGPEWAEREARRQVAAALGESSEDAPGGRWWMGRPRRGTWRWHPLKGTPRYALPVDPSVLPVWEPEPVAEAGPEPGLEEPVPAVARQAQDRVRRLHNEQVAADAAAVRADAGSEESTFLSDGTEITPPARQAMIEEAAAAGRPFVLEPQEVRPRDRVVDARSGEPGTVVAVDERGVTVDHGRERVPGVPGSRRVMVLRSALAAGALRRVEGVELHPSVEAVLEVLHTQIGAYEIPDDLSGVTDVDSLLGSLGALLEGAGQPLGVLADRFAGSPVHAVVVEALADFSGALAAMGAAAGEVHERWQDNPDNDHDLRRARGEVRNAALFNV